MKGRTGVRHEDRRTMRVVTKDGSVTDQLEYFGIRRRYPFVVGSILVLIVGGALFGLGWAFLGPGGDLRLLKVRVLMDGSAPGHTFSHGSRLEGESFAELNLRGAEFPGVRAEQADFHQTKLRGAKFTACKLDRANFRHADLLGARFPRSSLEGADLRGADLSRADLSEASLRFALLAHANLSGANLEGADLTGVVGLTVDMVRRCANWHLALYDEETAQEIRSGAPLKELQARGFATWDDWLNEQRRLAITARSFPAGAVPGAPD